MKSHLHEQTRLGENIQRLENALPIGETRK